MKSKEMQEYFDKIKQDTLRCYTIANSIKQKGLDPDKEVSIVLTENMAERVEGLISVVAPQIRGSGLVKHILELEKKYGAQSWRVAFEIAEKIANGEVCAFKDKREAMEVALRVGLAYITNGVVSSPLEGFVRLELKKRKDEKEYFALYFSGPIRSAGTTAVCVFVALSDYIRKVMGYAEYDPTKEEIKRSSSEIQYFHERASNLQYLPSEREIEFLVEHLPVQIDGDPSEKIEVPNYKDLKRIATNRLRNGFCLAFAEGLSQKLPKFWGKFIKWHEEVGMQHWKFVEEYIILQKEVKSKGKVKSSTEKISQNYTYIKDLVAGRPILGYPLRSGGFRLRYGRSRNSGLSSEAIHPATQFILNNYLAIGTQLRTERPNKSTVLGTCDSIEGPIIKLKNGDVVFIKTEEQAKELKEDIKEILYLGDILINYGDFLVFNHVLVPAGYNEEWWALEVEKASSGEIKNPYNLSFDESYEISKKYKIPFYPTYIYHWKDISYGQFIFLIDWLNCSVIKENKIILPLDSNLNKEIENSKRTLEILGIPHKVVNKEYVVIEDEWCNALKINLGFYNKKFDYKNIIKKTNADKNILENINLISDFVIRDKSGTFIGSRMGRPEKSKMRKLTGSPQVLFPVGDEGGRLRCFQSALDFGKVNAQFPILKCETCNKETIYPLCETCNNITKQLFFCKICGKIDHECEHPHVKYEAKDLDIKHYFNSALNILNLKDYPKLIKGVRGTSNNDHIPENLVKGILRAIHNIYVNKDGTVRYDMIEMPITHFKSKEIGVGFERLIELGYTKDIYGKDLIDNEQILELKCQDLILPACDASLEEGADIVLFRIANFIDDLLEKFYGSEKYYNLKNKNDLVGHYVICLSPHTSAGITARIIGFSNTQGFLAHPFLHSTMRRDCLDYETYISVKDKDGWKIEKIGKFIEEQNPIEKADLFGTLKKNISEVYTWSNPGKKKILDITKHKPRKLIKINTEDGRTIQLTEDHKLFLKGKKEKRAYDLIIGDKLIVNYKKDIKEKDINSLFLPEIFKGRSDVMLRNVKFFLSGFEILDKNSNFYQRDSYPLTFIENILNKYNKTLKDLPDTVTISIKRDNIQLPISIPLDNGLLEIIGLYISEGYSRKNDSKKSFYQVSISGNKEIKNLTKKIFLSHFNIKSSYENNDQVTFSSKLLYELFNNYLKLGGNAKNKRIPSIFLDLRKDKIAALLRGYYEGDGSVSLSDIRVSCDSVSEGLKHDLSFILSRFGIFTKFYEYCKEPGPKVRKFYEKKGKIPKFRITKIIIPSNFVIKFKEIGFISKRKNKILNKLCQKNPYGMKIDFDEMYAYPKILKIEKIEEKPSYCLNVEGEHNFFANNILVHNCDGDEAGIMLLMDALLNFSRKYLPGHRGATQDEPLVLNSNIVASEVDDMVYDMDICWKYPLELYEAALEYKRPHDIKIETIRDRLGKEGQYEGFGFTQMTSDLNNGVRCSAYKTIPTMEEKVLGQMDLAEKIRAVDSGDVAKLIIDRHFMRDIKGNLRKFSTQQFRCVMCNEKFRRPPLTGVCKCGGRIIFTVSEGNITKYLEPSMSLAQKYELPAYLKQTLELVKQRVESVFGKADDKQEGLGKWFG